MATRNFKLIGATLTDSVNATITINGVQVFDGNLTSNPDRTLQAEIAAGSISINNNFEETIVPVVITINSGTAGIGMFQWNCVATMPNPLYTPEEYAIVNNPGTTRATQLTIVIPKASPPLSTEEIALVETTTDSNQVSVIMYDHNCLFDIPNESTFGYGRSPELCTDNRDLVAVDGVPVAVPDNSYITVDEGQTLTFNQIIFSRYSVVDDPM